MSQLEAETIEGETSDAGRLPRSLTTKGGLILASKSEFDDRVLAALGKLGDTERACMLLRSLLDMPYREISRVLDVPEGTAMSHVHRARRALREELRFNEPKSGASGESRD